MKHHPTSGWKKYSWLGISLLILGAYVAALAFGLTQKTPVIINIHEHMESQQEATAWNKVMQETGLTATLLMGSPKQTITLKEEDGFTLYDTNNNELLALAQNYPDQYIAFCTINPLDDQKLDKLQSCVARGAKGLKLYAGHGVYHNIKLNDETMLPIYEYAERIGLPIIFHVNLNKYEREFKSVLQDYPKLVINCPHYCLSSLNLDRLTWYFEKYPNFYTDISFGYYTFMGDGLWRISRSIEKFRELFLKYPDRFLFGTDIVITAAKTNSEKWQNEMPQYVNCYRDFLEKKSYRCAPIEQYLRQKKEDFPEDGLLQGLNLPAERVEQIYEHNALQFLGSK